MERGGCEGVGLGFGGSGLSGSDSGGLQRVCGCFVFSGFFCGSFGRGQGVSLGFGGSGLSGGGRHLGGDPGGFEAVGSVFFAV